MNFAEFRQKFQKVAVQHYTNQASENPLVSICVQTYQHKEFIKECLDGILMQKTKFAFEILLGDDASTDGTREICLEYAQLYPDKIRLFLHHRDNNIKINGSPTGRFNLLYNLYSAKGKYIALCEGDDYWTDPFKLQKQVDFLETHLECAICFHNSLVCWEDNRPPILFPHSHPKISSIENLFRQNFMTTASVMYRAGLIEIPDWLYELSMADWPLHILNAQHGKIGYIDEVMSVYRMHSKGAWSSKSQKWQMQEIIKMLDTIKQHIDLKYEPIINKSIDFYRTSLANLISVDAIEQSNIVKTDKNMPKSNRDKHILLYTDDSGVGGVAQYNHSIICKIAALGYQVSCVQEQSTNPLVQQQQKLGVNHLWLEFDPVKDFYRSLTNTTDAQEILNTAKPDLIIFSDACPFSNFAAKRVATQLQIPYIIVEGFVAPYLAERFNTYLNELSHYFAKAKEVIAVSTENLNLLHTLFKLPKGKGRVIYYGRPTSYFTPPLPSNRDRLRQELGIPSDAVVCFTAARLSHVKGYQYQLEAIKQLKQSSVWSKLYFVWAGSGDLESQLQQAIHRLGVTERVKLLGQRWDISDWLDASDIFILPSELEGMPLAIMEAMAKGLPVIASAVSGIPEELGNTGKLLVDPKENPELTIKELATTIQAWGLNPELRRSVGQACRKRAEEIFKEERMLKETMETMERVLLPMGDYVSPGFSIIQPDSCFPNMVIGDTNVCQWSYLRREIPHNWYVDRRQPTVGFLSRDEAHILYNTALQFRGKKALEIGCWLGWSACHLALAGVELDVIDPLLARSEFYESVSASLQAAGVIDSTNLIAGYSPQKVEELAAQLQRKWSLIFIDGNHDAPGPLDDAMICEKLAEPDALIVFHDLASPEVAQGLDYLKQRGWKTLVYQTMQIMGVAWRGNVEPVRHQPDPKINWKLPSHLQSYTVSNLDSKPSLQAISADDATEVKQFNQSPLVSVVIPCYKQAHFLPQAVASVVAQIYENWEIIIVNDGSPDNTREVAQRLIELYGDKNIRLIEKENGGLASARNAGIEVANGEYILPLDADDKLNINSIGRLVKLALSNDEFCIAFGSYQMFGIEHKQVISVKLYSPENIKSFNMLHPSSLFPKAVWKLVGGYKTDMMAQGYEDWNFWLSCHQKNISFRGTREITTYYRRHDDSMYLLESRPNHNKLYAELVWNHPQLFGVEQIRESANIIVQVKNIIEDLSKFELLQIQNIIKSYQTKPFDSISLANICDLRKQITDLLLSLAPQNLKIVFLSNLGEVYQMLLFSSIKNEPLNDKEQNLVNELLIQISKGFNEPKAIQYLLAVMLYCRAERLPLQPDLTNIFQWLLEDYLKYIFKFPCLFQEIGEADNYYRYLEQWLDYLQENISNNPESALWQYIAKFFLQTANFIPMYFTTENVKGIYTKRADLMELALKIQGCQIDYDFPERPVERKKIRLGILAAHFQPSTETFHTVPAYKHLDWNNFEIILFTASSNNSRLERYCAGHADALVTLPSDLQSQVQTIRDANLDLLLIATNVTAVTNNITLLALHRLARVQVTFGSCPTTSGIRNIDYFISGSLSEPVSGGQEHYREKLVTLDGVGYCFDYPSELDNPTIKPSRENWGATEKTIVFTSGANCYKIIPELRETWAKILAAVPDSILVLYPFSPSWSNSYPATAFLDQMHTALAKYGVDRTRLVVLDTLPSRADVKEVLKLADVYLDSYRHSGGHSLVDALEVGLPTVVLEGNALRARHGTAYLRQIQILDLITDNEIDYINLAVKLGTNPELRKQTSDRIKQKMQQNPSFLDSRSYSAQMGALFQQLFQQYQADALANQFRLRDINLVMFPDWHQSEESLYEDFANVLKTMSNNPDKSRMTLLIDTDGIDGEEANLLFSGVAMNLFMEEAVEIADELEVSLLDDLTKDEWELLSSLLQGKISLVNENQNAIAKAKAQSLKVYS